MIMLTKPTARHSSLLPRWIGVVACVLGVHIFAAPPAFAVPAPLTACVGYALQLSEPVTSAVERYARITIKRDGRVMGTISGEAISGVDCVDVTGDRRPEVIVETWSGGAHCCSTMQVFLLQPSFRRILSYQAGSAAGFVARRAPGGRLGLVLGDDGLAYYDDLCFACSPTHMPLVACYAGGRFVECTRQFPGLIQEAIRISQDQLKEALASTHESRPLYMKGAALGIYAGHALLGRGADGLTMVRRMAPDPEVNAWLARQRDGVMRWIGSRPARLTR